jgi:hypothetical protein
MRDKNRRQNSSHQRNRRFGKWLAIGFSLVVFAGLGKRATQGRSLS